MRRGLLQPGACCALLLALAWPVAAADDAAGWLARMRQSLAEQHYQGTLVYFRDGQLDALRVVHRAAPDGPYQRLFSLSGEPRELVRRGGSARLNGVGKIAPGIIVGDHPPTRPAPDLLGRYRLILLGTDRTAERSTRVLEIRPRDSFRYGYRLWLDQLNAMPLKSVAFGAEGVAVEQWMFTAITFGEPPSDADLGLDWPLDTDPTAIAAMPGDDHRFQVRDLPPGFQLISQIRRGADNEHRVFSDGVASISLYIEPLAEQAPNLSGLLQRGALSVFGRVLSGRQITVVGEVPPVTVERIAQGVVADRAR